MSYILFFISYAKNSLIIKMQDTIFLEKQMFLRFFYNAPKRRKSKMNYHVKNISKKLVLCIA